MRHSKRPGTRPVATLSWRGYDLRLTPDLAGFLPRTERLIEQTWRQNQHHPGIEFPGADIDAQWAVFDATLEGWNDDYDIVSAHLDQRR
jgi:hypothetical protein